ncbi:MAG: methionyl-tRNA formyltransferase [Thermoleophilaceae bacterium]|jgi:folate-dependent phosphoribosylglycinamide formyltransferase PurN|nr:methionyl-tRNA formyltransferase [Thermoleophilaceae bacterium]
MNKIAVMTSECAQASRAVCDLVERNADRVAVVITSDMERPARGGKLHQAIENYRRSGLAFCGYLLYSFLFYFWYVAADRWRARLTRSPRRRVTLEELCRSRAIRYVETTDVNGPEALAALRAEELDFIVIYWFDQIIREDVIQVPRRAVINVHAAPLPQCRGLFPVLFSATKNRWQFGITAHEVTDTTIDNGPVLAQTLLTPPHGRSVLWYDDYVNRAGVDMTCRVLDEFDAYHANCVEFGEGSYFSYPSRSDVAEARRAGLKLFTVRDFFAVCDS